MAEDGLNGRGAVRNRSESMQAVTVDRIETRIPPDLRRLNQPRLWTFGPDIWPR
jgi:hypothetical protein